MSMSFSSIARNYLLKNNYAFSEDLVKNLATELKQVFMQYKRQKETKTYVSGSLRTPLLRVYNNNFNDEDFETFYQYTMNNFIFLMEKLEESDSSYELDFESSLKL